MFREFIAINPSHAPQQELWEGQLIEHSEKVARLTNVHDKLRAHNPETIVYPESFNAVPIELLKAVHTPEYIDYLLSLKKHGWDEYRLASSFGYSGGAGRPSEEHGLFGYYSMDSYTPIKRDTIDAALVAASGAYTAALSIKQDNRAAYAIVRPPGHHAGRKNMGGYCYINNSAVAVYTLNQSGRVGILDVDFHHGNGTFDIFEQTQAPDAEQTVLPVSIHADPARKFPYRTGYANQKGSKNFRYINYPLEAGVDDKRYNGVLLGALRDLSDFQPEFLVVSVGFDTFGRDPIADFALTTPYYYQMAREIMQLGLPTVFVQEGGYNTEAIGDNALSLVKGIEEGLKY